MDVDSDSNSSVSAVSLSPPAPNKGIAPSWTFLAQPQVNPSYTRSSTQAISFRIPPERVVAQDDVVRIKRDESPDSPEEAYYTPPQTPIPFISPSPAPEGFRGMSLAVTESTEAYNTPYTSMPTPGTVRDTATPEATSFWRPMVEPQNLAYLNAIKEEVVDEDGDIRMTSVEPPPTQDENQNQLQLPQSIPELSEYLRKSLPRLYIEEKRVKLLDRDPFTSGGYAEIWRGSYQRREVAVKVMRQTVKGINPHAQKQVANELVIWSGLKHRNVLRLTGFIVKSRGAISLVAHFQANGSASKYLQGKSGQTRLNVLLGAITGLKYLHSKGIVHSDFRGDNVLVSRKGEAVIADFGLSKVLSEALTGSISNAGNLAWTSPELLIGTEAVHTMSSDIWACGMTIFELMTGCLPYHHIRNKFAIPYSISKGDLPQFPEAADFGISVVCQSCWKYAPGDRKEADDVLKSMRGVAKRLQQEIKKACETGNLDLINTILSSIFDIPDEFLQGDELVPILDAASRMQRAPEFILNLNPEQRTTALHHCVKREYLDLVTVLLRDVDGLQGLPQQTYLLLALENGHQLMADFLISKGSDVNALTSHSSIWGDGLSALHLAAKNGFDSTVEILIANGAIVDARSNYNETPLHYALASGHQAIANLLISKGADVNATQNRFLRLNPLQLAVKKGFKTTVEMLMANGARVNTGSYHSMSPLHLASEIGHRSIAELLISKGANVNALGCWNQRPELTPLHLAAGNGFESTVDVLIANGADVDARSNYNETPLHHALENGRRSRAELLISNGADVNIATTKRPWAGDFGLTPLHLAAKMDLQSTVALLIAKGAVVDARSVYGKTLLDLAWKMGID